MSDQILGAVAFLVGGVVAIALGFVCLRVYDNHQRSKR